MEDQNPPTSLQLPVPVAFSCVGANSDGVEYKTEHIRICQDGFVIRSPKALGIGAALLLKVRTAKSGSPSQEVWCSARVESEQALPGGALGYRVRIEAFSALL